MDDMNKIREIYGPFLNQKVHIEAPDQWGIYGTLTEIIIQENAAQMLRVETESMKDGVVCQRSLSLVNVNHILSISIITEVVTS